MYSLTSNCKVIGTADTFAAACEAAKIESTVGADTIRTWKDGRKATGRAVTVWSGTIDQYGRGTTSHVRYCCGAI